MPIRWSRAEDGALVADIRLIAKRRESGVIPGSIAIAERNVLEWCLDLASDSRIAALPP